jgi:UDP-GlcNAc:undecaprenyl-phosphate GlcNAc-1-phosphate transferase
MLAAIVIAMLSCGMLCLLSIPLAPRINLVDHPLYHKIHGVPTPLGGGPALLMTLGLALALLAGGNPFMQALLAGGALMFLVGLVDDYRHLSASVRFLVQVVACLIVVAHAGVQLDDFGRLLWDRQITLGWLAVPVTLFAALGVINAFNMIDGLDGLAGSLFLVAAGGMAILAAAGGQVAILTLLLAACGAVLGYLLLNARFPWNPKARVFMGDAGSQLLGFLLAWCFIALGNDHNETAQRAFMPMTAVWLFAIPLLDTATNIWRRWRAGESALKADQHHLHHAFLRAGFSVRQSWLMITAAAVLAAAIGLIFEVTGAPDYLSFWTFMAVAFAFHFYMRQTWRNSRFLGREFTDHVHTKVTSD